MKFFSFILFLAVYTWASCWSGLPTGYNPMYNNGCKPCGTTCQNPRASGAVYAVNPSMSYQDGFCSCDGSQVVDCTYTIFCNSRASADSLICETNPSLPGCESYDRCAVYRQQCDQLGGVFTGHNTPTGCAASCNTCGSAASKNILDIKIESCCNQGLAPSVERMCITPDIATGDGMQVSSNANLKCVDPNLGDENLNLYVEYCEDNPPGSSDSNQSSGGGDGSSSSGEGSSSSGDEANSSVSGENGGDYDYYPILDTIRDSVVNIRKNVEKIYLCMTTPGACPGLSPNIQIDVPSDSNFLKNINSTIGTTNIVLDTSLKNGNERIRNSIASANDTLIDSLRKFMSATDGAVTVDTLHRIHQSIQGVGEDISSRLGYGDTATKTLREELSGYFTGADVDTGSVGFGSSWVTEGDNLGDSLGRASGWIGGLDTVNVDSVFRAGGFDSLSVDSVSAAVDDSLSGVADSLNNILVAQNDSIKRGLPDSLDVWADSLISYSPFASFDSLIFGQLGAKIPNSNECPDGCGKWTINLPRFGLFNFTVDYGLCLGRVPLGGMNVLGFIRLLLRIVVVWSCIWIVFNALTRRKE